MAFCSGQSPLQLAGVCTVAFLAGTLSCRLWAPARLRSQHLALAWLQAPSQPHTPVTTYPRTRSLALVGSAALPVRCLTARAALPHEHVLYPLWRALGSWDPPCS